MVIKSNTVKIILVILMLIVFVCVLMLVNKPILSQTYENVEINNNQFRVLRADSDLEKSHGLSGIKNEYLEENNLAGMLFVFKESSLQYFWMKNMLFDLDLIWIDGEEIVKIDDNISFLLDDGEIVYMDSEPYKVNRVLELPAGFIQRFDIKVGDSVIID